MTALATLPDISAAFRAVPWPVAVELSPEEYATLAARSAQRRIEQAPARAERARAEAERIASFKRQIGDAEKDEPPFDQRAAVVVSAETVEALIFDWYGEHPPTFHPIELGWDLHRQFGDAGYELYGDLALKYSDDSGAEIDADWASFDRARNNHDRLLIDECAEAKVLGGYVPADVAVAIDKFTVETLARKAARVAADDAADMKQRDADHAAWIAEGSPAALAQLAETARLAEWNAVMDKLESDVATSAAELRAKIDSIVKKEAAVKLVVDNTRAPVPVPANAVSMIGGNEFEGTAWVSIHRGMPAAGDWANAAVLLRRLKIEVRFNAWTERSEIREAGGDWTERQDWHLDKIARIGSSAPYDYRPSGTVLQRAIDSLARENLIDPARDFLDQLEASYDGVPRLATWLHHACGVSADKYYAAVGATIFGGIVSRIRVPGIKFDLMPVFVSEQQGTAKSTLARLLALNDAWFIEDIALGEASKELVLLLAGKSVVEISEMRTRGEVDTIKAMVSRTHDEGRPAYGRSPVKRARRHIFVGTTNEPEFLEDISGGRRFLPIMVQGEIDLDFVRANLGQLVGEAARLQSQGAGINLPREVWTLAGKHQEAARSTSATEELLRDWYACDENDVYVPAAEIVRRLADERQTTSHKAIASVMRRIGYQPDRTMTARLWVKSATGKYHPNCQHIGRGRQMLLPPPGGVTLPPMPTK